MTASNDPDEIRAEIERTRADLSDNVNALADSVNPAHVAGRQVDKVKGAVFGVKDKVMGVRSRFRVQARLGPVGRRRCAGASSVLRPAGTRWPPV